MSTLRFEQLPATQQGMIGESVIARWIRSRGSTVLPAYEKEIDTGKGPRLYAPRTELIAPDMFVLSPRAHTPVYWIEAKHKSVWSWYRIGGYWTTGIDLRHYLDYCRVADMYPYPVYLLFLHSKDYDPNPKFAADPWPCPVGLFGQNIEHLRRHESHRSDRWGRTGMVYWSEAALRRYAELHEVLPQA